MYPYIISHDAYVLLFIGFYQQTTCVAAMLFCIILPYLLFETLVTHKFSGPNFSVTSVTSTSKVHTAPVLELMMSGNWKIQLWGGGFILVA
jgi:hypothetical protein